MPEDGLPEKLETRSEAGIRSRSPQHTALPALPSRPRTPAILLLCND